MKLYFVYNVDATISALMKDFVHRLLSPSTYPCQLCDVTYGRFFKKSDWRQFLKTLPIKVQFYTRDQFIRRHHNYNQLKFPVILLQHNNNELLPFIDQNDFASITELKQLQQLILKRLSILSADKS